MSALSRCPRCECVVPPPTILSFLWVCFLCDYWWTRPVESTALPYVLEMES